MRHLHQPNLGQGQKKTDLRGDMLGNLHCGSETDQQDDDGVKPLSRMEAQVLTKKLGSPSLEGFLIKALFWQALCSVCVAVLAWLLSANVLVMFSALYGALSVVLPSALVVRVVIGQAAASKEKQSSGRLGQLFILELVKVAVTVCLLAAAPLVLESPNWVALVAGFVVTLKVYGLVALRGLGQTKRVQNNWD